MTIFMRVCRTLAAAARVVAIRHRSDLSDKEYVPCLYFTGFTPFCTPFSDSFLNLRGGYHKIR
jgi:hypothetical protein